MIILWQISAITGMIKYLSHQIKQTVVQEWDSVSLSLVLSITHVATSALTGTEVWLKDKVTFRTEGKELIPVATIY